MPQQSAEQLIDRLLTDADFTKTVAEAQDNPALQEELKQEYGLTETGLSKALLHKFPLTDEVLDEINGGLLSSLSFKRVLKKAILGATIGGAAGKYAGPKGALIGAGLGAIAVAGEDILEEAIDSLLNWKW